MILCLIFYRRLQLAPRRQNLRAEIIQTYLQGRKPKYLRLKETLGVHFEYTIPQDNAPIFSGIRHKGRCLSAIAF